MAALDWIEAHPGAAAWVQAIGSLLALGTALLLPYLQRRTLERARALKARPVVMDMWNAARDAYYFCTDNDGSMSRADVADHLLRARRGIEDFPAHELQAAAIAHLFQARDRLVLLEKCFSSDDDKGLVRVPAAARRVSLAIVAAMDSEPALAPSRPLRDMMERLAADTGLEALAR